MLIIIQWAQVVSVHNQALEYDYRLSHLLNGNPGRDSEAEACKEPNLMRICSSNEIMLVVLSHLVSILYTLRTVVHVNCRMLSRVDRHTSSPPILFIKNLHPIRATLLKTTFSRTVNSGFRHNSTLLIKYNNWILEGNIKWVIFLLPFHVSD